MHSPPRQNSPRAGFTLVELLISIAIIAVLATFVLVALAGVTEKAREDRTKAQIAKVHELIMEKWETYLYRRMPPTRSRKALERINRIKQGQADSVGLAARDRLHAVRELMRMELPSHREDVLRPAQMIVDPLTNKPYEPAVWRAYRARVRQAKADSGVDWTMQHEGAECLYLILSQMRYADSSALASFSENEIGDVDGDGMKEILDAWGHPIGWLRWAPAYISPLQRPVAEEPEQDDMFDLAKVGSGYQIESWRPRALYPLIFSAGPDQLFGIVTGRVNPSSGEVVAWADALNDPYDRNENRQLFTLGGISAEDAEAAADNITNHLLTTR